MLKKALLVSSACFMLAGCATDKISFSSEVGGEGGTTGLLGNGGSGGSGGSGDSGGTGGSSGGGSIVGSGGTISDGLGVTGGGGLVSNIVGTDPLGGTIDSLLGGDNAISQILGGGSGGAVPQLAAAIAGDPDAQVLGDGLGVTGDNGLLADLMGSDLGGVLLGTQGVIPSGLAGGNDGLLGALLGDGIAGSPLAPVVQAVPTSTLAGALDQVPQLGLTGDGGVVDNLLGVDLVGNLLGTGGGVTTVLAGGGSGAIGSQVPAGTSPLEPVGTAVTGVLGVVAGTSPSPIGDVTSALGSVPLAGSAIGTVLDTVSGTAATVTSPVSNTLAPVTSTVTSVVAPVTDTLSSVPVVGGVVGGLLGK